MLGPLAKGLTAEVTGTNYVIADASGLSLTGLKVTKTIPKDAEFKGFQITGDVSIEYVSASSTYTIKGDVNLTSEADNFGKSALNNVSAGLDLTFSVTTAGISFYGGGFTIAGSFQILGLEVSSSSSQPISFQYDRQHDQFEVGGALTITFDTQTITLNLGSSTGQGAGIVIKDGVLQQFDGYIAGSITLFGVQITSTGLTFQYQAAADGNPSQFELFGTLSITLPTGGNGTAITASLGNQQIPGLVLKDGSLTQLNIGLDTNKPFSIFGFNIVTHNANVEWQSADNTFLVSGTFGADFKIFQGTFQLGDDLQDGLIIKNGGVEPGGRQDHDPEDPVRRLQAQSAHRRVAGDPAGRLAVHRHGRGRCGHPRGHHRPRGVAACQRRPELHRALLQQPRRPPDRRNRRFHDPSSRAPSTTSTIPRISS